MDMFRECMVCGKSFKVCNTCRNDVDEMYQWRRVVCCPEHFQHHVPIIDYVRGTIDKATAKKDLENAIQRYGNVEYTVEIEPIVAEILCTNTEIKTDSKKAKKE